MSKKYDDLFSIENPRAFAIQVMAQNNFKSSEELALFFKKMPYCVAPWLHSHLNPAGERKLCCVALPSGISGEVSFHEFWNSSYMQEVRQKMIAHRPPPECVHCIHFKGVGAQRSIYLHLLLGLMDLPQIEWKEQTDLLPVSVDYRINRFCNFTCRMCAATASSAIESLEEKAHIKFTENKISSEDFTRYKNEMFTIIASGRLLDINFADGEPFISPLHWEILEYLVSRGLSKKVILRYSSNISTLNYKGIFIPEYFAQNFNKVFISMSIDGVGKTAELVRDGLQWEKFYQNFKTLKEHLGVKAVRFNITVSLPVLLGIVAMSEFLESEKIEFSMDSAYASGRELILSPLALDSETLQNIIQARRPRINHPLILQYLDHLTEHRSDEYFKKLKENFDAIRTYYIKLDDAAKRSSTMDFLASTPELSEWWNQICPHEYLTFLKSTPSWVRTLSRYMPNSLGRVVYKIHFYYYRLMLFMMFGPSVKMWYRHGLNQSFFKFGVSDLDVSVEFSNNRDLKANISKLKSILAKSLVIKETNVYYPYSLSKLKELMNPLEAKRDWVLTAKIKSSQIEVTKSEALVFLCRMLWSNAHLYGASLNHRDVEKWRFYFSHAGRSKEASNIKLGMEFVPLVALLLETFNQKPELASSIERVFFYVKNKIPIHVLFEDLDHPYEMVALFPQLFCSLKIKQLNLSLEWQKIFHDQLSWEIASVMGQLDYGKKQEDLVSHVEKLRDLSSSSEDHLTKTIDEFLQFIKNEFR